ncbi:hypothetical protein [Litoribrevibacter albus]|uniref:Uncharacterized protein n=1 Tax=Litoribrevibacter albus TaxID=1473156 RepID=A0AA37S764_9GAMM|nr:hypothetical protein [Litoribrevibacter albus]GLQ30397.1 hypothetical protein GCM10007876_08750 [Litoribrevibacter albus]
MAKHKIMTRQKIVTIHATTSTLALLLILSFFLSTTISELIGNQELITQVKTLIFYAIWALLPCMAIAGITGNKLAGKATKGLIGNKKKRMPIIAANGILILIPAAIYLKTLAISGTFDTSFYLVQGLELFAGFTNLVLMSLNLGDGLKIKRSKLKRGPSQEINA